MDEQAPRKRRERKVMEDGDDGSIIAGSGTALGSLPLQGQDFSRSTSPKCTSVDHFKGNLQSQCPMESCWGNRNGMIGLSEPSYRP
ncbi:hypothetical protein IAQ61_000654 [Plenodomus lingam]|uniref:uncharacterized protein n=1 Tax=Leptosphaeria maculans TaxID=5022 RepID=UPI0033314E00|nr:hypothetical protein IAQ61_000654 [Plenodomus lingam]